MDKLFKPLLLKSSQI